VIEAGARFVVSPILRLELVGVAHAAGAVTMLGAYTPTEAYQAWEAGSDFVKIFPADTLGPVFCKAIRAPMPQLQLVPTGGVDLKNAVDFLKAGCVAVGVGGSMVSPALIRESKWSELTALAKQYTDAIHEYRMSRRP
jgi:2-dehydro-3-deoxyphosphogluconate aldolase/(4S)-4-hydroxy-2-oxoglutarate aldolase